MELKIEVKGMHQTEGIINNTFFSSSS